jgi:3-hydroxy-9,10-secoandrosta-1,3,5(10)-triene-9,17-dione monooxygenase reductase component
MDSSPNPDVLDAAETTPEHMRRVLGHFASGVVVVTTAGAGGPAGFTCQSFASLSIDPPLIMFGPSRASATWPRIGHQGRFCVNILAQHHDEISDQFARSGTDKFAGVAWSPGASGLPILHGVCAWIECTLEAEYDGGDHTIVVGRVQTMWADVSPVPLLFHRGSYGISGEEATSVDPADGSFTAPR